MIPRGRIAAAWLPIQIIGLLVGRAFSAPTLDAEELARCAGIQPDADRLACYDRLGGLAKARGAVPISGPAKRIDEVKTFGLNKQQLHEAPQGPEALTAAVKSLSSDANGNAYLLLDNGQTWTFSEANALLRIGDSVVIKRAALGSFLMTTPSKRKYHVHRIN